MLLPEETLPNSHTSFLLCLELCPSFTFFSKQLLSVPYVLGTVLDPEGGSVNQKDKGPTLTGLNSIGIPHSAS